MQDTADVRMNCRIARLAMPSCFSGGLSIIMLAILSAGAVAAPSCTASFLFCGNCVRPIIVETKKNTTCQITYSTGGAIFSQKVIKRGIGVYGTTNVTTGAYQPKPGYVGKDYFEVEIHYERGGTKLITTLKADVRVTE
jgi:hypothetical protein